MSVKEVALFNFKGGLFSTLFLIQAKLSELDHFRCIHTNLMQNKITWLGLRWQYHVGKQFPYFSHDSVQGRGSEQVTLKCLFILLTMLVSVNCTAQFKQQIICTDECTVLYSLAQGHFSNQIKYMQNIRIAKLLMSG